MRHRSATEARWRRHLFGGADTLFGGAPPPAKPYNTPQSMYNGTQQTPCCATEKNTLSPFGGASVALRWRTRKPRDATKPTAPPAPPKREDLRGFEVEKALPDKKEPQWSLFGGAGGAGGAPPVVPG